MIRGSSGASGCPAVSCASRSADCERDQATRDGSRTVASAGDMRWSHADPASRAAPLATARADPAALGPVAAAGLARLRVLPDQGQHRWPGADRLSAASHRRVRIAVADGPARDAGLAARGPASPCAAQPLTSSAGPPGWLGARRAAAIPAGRHRARRSGHRSPSPPPPPAHTAPPSPSPPAASPPGDQQGGAAAQVLALINQARAQAGLPAYTLSTGLGRSSAAHNSMMASGCGLSHQCPGEPSLGARETDAGVHWTSAGENIGEGGPVADTDSAVAQLAVTITQDMLNERPPDDGHRLNILSSAFHHIGITVLWSDSGTVWMTQDFSD